MHTVEWYAFFTQARDQEKRFVWEKVLSSLLIEHKFHVQTHLGRYLPISLDDAISVDSETMVTLICIIHKNHTRSIRCSLLTPN